MREISKNSAPAAHLCLGVSTSSDSSGPLVVTVIGRAESHANAVRVRSEEPVEVRPEPIAAHLPVNSRPVPEPELFAMDSTPAKVPKIKQDVLPLEPVARGRFEKIEPTIVEGEDLDVPTFLRLKVKKKTPL